MDNNSLQIITNGDLNQYVKQAFESLFPVLKQGIKLEVQEATQKAIEKFEDKYKPYMDKMENTTKNAQKAIECVGLRGKQSFDLVQQVKKYLGIKKIKDNDFYVIGRITVFKDDYYAEDNNNETIFDTRTNTPYLHNGSYWPSAYSRNVWYFNVELAKEAIKEMGFNEIQFDYVRFPDRTSSVEEFLDYKNKYNETKAQAIQRFIMYACDEIHKLKAYVSIDVFAESAHSYVTSYGQYFPAISNIADVVSAMPYPDHFNKYQYGFTNPVWTTPYELLKYWGENYVQNRQKETTTPAKIRTWIQAYDTIKEPYIKYDSEKISEQIKGLYDAKLDNGFITWNSGSSLLKYNEIKEALSKNYKE